MKVVILVPDGVGVKNYLFSSFIDKLQAQAREVIIFHKLSKSAIKEIQVHKPKLRGFFEMYEFIESPKTRFLRETLAYARLLRNKKKLNNKTILKFWSPNKKGVKKKLLYFLAEIVGFIFSKSYCFVLFGDKIFESTIKKTKQTILYNDVFRKIKPDMVLNLHQRSPLVSPVISAANELNITTASVIFSWDNIPKARLVNRYDSYFVWSDLMKKELKKLYPEIHKNQIKVTGTPQFEFYFDENLKDDKATFFKKHGLDIHKKIICFSGDDELTSPFDAQYLEDICKAVVDFPEEEQPQILFRRCPVDFSERYDEVIKKYKFVVKIDPDWRVEKNTIKTTFSAIYPSFNDIKLLVNTCLHSDVVINLGSTMAHDFATLNKPCLYLNYTPVTNNYWSTNTVYTFEHFKSMQGLDAVGWINDKSELKEKIQEVLAFPNKVAKDKKLWLKKIVHHPLENNTKKLVDTIKELLN